jgi:hypothetical protein
MPLLNVVHYAEANIAPPTEIQSVSCPFFFFVNILYNVFVYLLMVSVENVLPRVEIIEQPLDLASLEKRHWL